MDEPADLTYWLTFPPFISAFVEGPADYLYYKELERITNVHFEFSAVAGAAGREQFNILLSGGEYTDIIGNFGNLYPGGIDGGIQDEIIIPLNDYLETCAPDYYAALSIDPNIMRDAKTDNGNIGGFYMISDETFADMGVVIRQDWLDELDLEVPKTYDEYYNVLTAFKNEKGADAAMWVPLSFTYNNGYFGRGFDIFVDMYSNTYTSAFTVDDNGKVHYSLYDDGFYEYLKVMTKWFQEGLIYQDFLSDNASNISGDMITQGRSGVWLSDASNINTWYQYADTDSFDICGAYDPVVNEGDKNHLLFAGGSLLQAGFAPSISTQCDQVELACKVLNYAYTDDGYILTNFGVEGETFEYVDGKPRHTDIIVNNPDGMSFMAARFIYLGGQGAMRTTAYMQLHSFNDKQLEAVNRWVENSVDASHYYPPFASLTGEQSEIFKDYFSPVATYCVEAAFKFIFGEVELNDDTWAAYKKTAEDLGVQHIIDAKQGAYDNYLKR